MAERKDKLKNKAKVIKAVLKNPLLTTREIEKETGVSKSSVATHLKDNLDKIGQKDDRIMGICDKDLEIVTSIQEEIYNRVTNKAEDISIGDLARASDISTKRFTMFRGDITDSNGGLKDNIRELTTSELLQLANEN